MDLSAISSTYMDSVSDKYRMSSSSSLPANGASNFAELLEKAKSARENSITSSSSESALAEGRRYSSPEIDKTDKLYQLCLELETFLVKNLLTGMRNTVQKSGLVEESFAGKMYEDMLYDEYAKDFTKNAGFGLAETAYRQLKTYQNLPVE
jgi:flagellar protein FlgJ